MRHRFRPCLRRWPRVAGSTDAGRTRRSALATRYILTASSSRIQMQAEENTMCIYQGVRLKRRLIIAITVLSGAAAMPINSLAQG